MTSLDYIFEIDSNTHKNGLDWEVWSGSFNRKLRKENPELIGYIFSYWQIQNSIKINGKTKSLMRQSFDIVNIINGKGVNNEK